MKRTLAFGALIFSMTISNVSAQNITTYDGGLSYSGSGAVYNNPDDMPASTGNPQKDYIMRLRQERSQEGYSEKSNMSKKIGISTYTHPKFPGANAYDSWILPYVDIKYKDIFFLDSYDGLGVTAYRNNKFRVGGLIGLRPGRDVSDAYYLRGSKSIDTTYETGIFAYYNISESLDAELKVRSAFFGSGHEGVVSKLALNYEEALTNPGFEGTTIKFGTYTHYSSENYMKAFFGVSPSYASVSRLARYTPEASFSDIGLYAQFSYDFTPKWGMFTKFDYMKLTGDAADSPITQKGSENQMFITTAIYYKF